MPLNRYGGYGGYSSYSSNFTSSYGRSGSASPATLRATTPSRGFGSNSIINTILPEDRTYSKISSYYSPGTYSRLYSSDYERRDLKTIKTEELNTEDSRENNRNHAIPGEITRDTSLNIRGGKPVVRIVTQKAKENPYLNNPGWRTRIKEEEDKNSLTLGQRLALKHQIVDKPKSKEKSPSCTDNKKADSGEESEWTWETCSSSSQEQDGYEYTVVGSKKKGQNQRSGVKIKTPPPSESPKRPAVVYSRSNTTTLCSTEDNTAIKQTPSCPPTPNSSIRNRWLDSMLSDNSQNTKQQTSSERIPNFGKAVSMNKNLLDKQISKDQDKSATTTGSTRNLATSSSTRPVSWAGTQPLQDVQGNVHTKTASKPAAPPSSSGSSSSSPPLYKYKPNKAGSKSVFVESSDEETVEVTPGWRPGQPPRGDVVVKLTGNKNKSVITSSKDKSEASSNGKLTNKALTSDAVISSKVPGNMNEKYSIPGLFIKPSTKEAPKSVEAKLTLSPVEGKIHLTAKVKEEKGSYQSSIYTPTKSPVLESKIQQNSLNNNTVKKDSTLLSPASGVNSVCLSSVVETGNKSGESESEWEYYTESEPSDTEKDVKESKTSTNDTKTVQHPEAKTKESVLTTKVSGIAAHKSNNIPTINLNKNVPKEETLKTVQSKQEVKSTFTPLKDDKPKVVSSKQEETPKVDKSKEVPLKDDKTKAVPTDVKPKVIPVKHPVETTDIQSTENKLAGRIKNDFCKVTPVSTPVQSEPKKDVTTAINVSNNKANEAQKDVKLNTNIGETIPKSKDSGLVQNNVAAKNQTNNEKKKGSYIKETEQKNNTKVINDKTDNASAVKNNTHHISVQDKVKNEVNKKQTPDILSGPQQPQPLKQHDKDVSQVVTSDKIIKTSVPSQPHSQGSHVQTSAAPNPSTLPKNDLKPSTQTVQKVEAAKEKVQETSRTSSPENGMPATSLERLPSALQNMFIGNISPKSSPENAPKWYNNTPKEDANDQLISQMKNDFKKQVKKTQKEEESLIKVSSEPSNPWYNDDEDDMKELLTKRPSILKDVDMNQDRRLTPEENAAVIRMYGGVMFPGGLLEKTPKNLLFRIRKACGRTESMDKQQQRDSGFESQLLSQRTNSTGSNSSTISSFATFSESPSPSPANSDDDSDQYSDSDDDKKKIFKNPTNQAPTKTRPEFKKYSVKDFRFLRVLGKGSFGKVLLAELRNTQNFYAVKALRKDSILEDDDIECTMIERKVLALGVKHPFLCHLFCTLQTDSHLFFVMEYLNGGDLMFHIQQSGRFEAERARFYSAEIVCALKFLHRKGIVYRDLKLDNLLLDYEGHIRLVDFGMCKLQIYLDKTSDTFCGTPDYMAPEIIKGMKYTHSVDWWSFGVLLYEMLIGQSPFNGCDEDELFWSICNEQAYFPRFLSKEAKQILLLLLEKQPAKRLGVSDSIHGELRNQPFFKPIDFVKLEKKQIVPPYKPKLKNPMDVSYFDTAFTDEPVKLTPVENDFLSNLNQIQFKGFSYTNRQYTTSSS